MNFKKTLIGFKRRFFTESSLLYINIQYAHLYIYSCGRMYNTGLLSTGKNVRITF